MQPVPALRLRILAVIAVATLATLHAGERALIDLTRSPNAVMYMPDLADVRWTAGLLGERFDVARDTMVPHLGRLMSDPKPAATARGHLRQRLRPETLPYGHDGCDLRRRVARRRGS